MELFTAQGNNPKNHAQRNLVGRTHYVDDGTLRWHKSRIISARIVDKGLLFAIVTSDAADMNNTKRVFRYVIFDIFGTVVERQPLENGFRTSAQATKAMWAALTALDAQALTLAAIEWQLHAFSIEMQNLEAVVCKLGAQAAA